MRWIVSWLTESVLRLGNGGAIANASALFDERASESAAVAALQARLAQRELVIVDQATTAA